MPRPHTLLPLALATLAACAPTRRPGALSPVSARVTNEVVTQDALTFDAWASRIAALRGHGDAPRTYALARAAAWLGYARDAYAWDPRDGAADRALAETSRLVLALEAGEVPSESDVLPPASRTRADLWAALDSARAGGAPRTAPTTLANAELALVRASRLAVRAEGDALATRHTDAERVCEMAVQVTLAERLIEAMRAAAARVAAVPAPVPVRDAASARPMQRVVHFALNSSELAPRSRATLEEVVAMLRSHPGVSLVIEGFTDARGDALRNRELATRRAAAVRRYLDGAGLALGRVTMAGVGADSTASSSASPAAFARDPPGTLAFTAPDGQPLTVAGFRTLDVDHDGDLQIEQQKQQPRRARGTRTASRNTASLRSAPR